GDQRRRRQNTMYGVIAAVVVAVAVIPTALIATKGDGKASPPPFTNPSSVDPTPTPTPAPTSKIIVFPGGGVAIKAPTDTDKLVGTSDEFQAFIKTVWQQDHDAGCKTAEVDVTKYSPDGFGAGGVGGCGGYQALWVNQDDRWKEALGTQDEFICSDLARYNFPDGFAQCYVPDPAPAVVTFPGDGQSVNKESDAAALQGTTDEFKAFVIDQVAALQADAATQSHADCPDPTVAGITVKRFAQAGYAVGSVFLCPTGYAAIWQKVDGSWKQVIATQEQFTCKDLDRLDIPHSFIEGGCYQPKVFGPDDVAGVSLGMSSTEVKAAGASVETIPGSSGKCQAVKIASVGKKDDNDGLYDPAYGVFSITDTGPGEWQTPAGVGYGMSRADVERAYPKGHDDPTTGTWVVPLPGARHYEFNTASGTVTSMTLATDNTYCMFQ
ncbi:MAG: hypothetical protein ACJ716_04925, partial [Marmoricola sp.]